jgi:hypothetical protein
MRLLLIILPVVLWTYWIPLVVANITDTLSHQGVANRVRLMSPSNSAQLDEQDALKRSIRKLEAKISHADFSDLASLVESHAVLTQYAAKNPKRIHIAKYENSEVRHYFFSSYLALSLLLFLRINELSTRRPSVDFQLVHPKAIGLGLSFFVLCGWSNWWRNTPFGKEERTLFSYAHFDISPLGFVMQEVEVAGMMILTGYVTVLFLRNFSVDHAENQSLPRDAYDMSKEAKREFESWQIRSLLLVLAFLPWTMFYWRIVTSIGESRYFPSAVGIHIIWLFVWIVISVPPLRAFERWQDHTMACYRDRSPEEIAKIRAIEPISQNMFAITAIASTVSFVYPVIQALL